MKQNAGNKLTFFPNKPLFLPVCNTSLLKTLWEREKLLITINFSFFHSILYPFRVLSTIFIEVDIVLCNFLKFGRVLNLSFGKGLNVVKMIKFAFPGQNLNIKWGKLRNAGPMLINVFHAQLG